MENAIAAVQTGNISQRGAAKRFDVPLSTLHDRLKAAGVVSETGQVATSSESAPSKPKKAGKAERDQWWADYQAGFSFRKISEKYGRSRKSITAEIERRKEAEHQSEPTPTLAPSVPSAGSSAPFQWVDHPRLEGWNGKLNDRGQKIYNREVRSSRSRVRMAEQLAGIKGEIEKSMKAAGSNHRNGGGWAMLEADVAMVEATLQRENRPGIKETLEAVRHEAERIQKFASLTLQTLQLEKA